MPVPAGYKTYTFTYEDRPSFPGTILIGKYEATKSTEGGLNLTVYTTPESKAVAQQYADTAVKEFFFYTSTFGPPYNSTLNVVELPNDTGPIGLGAGDRCPGFPLLQHEDELPAAGQHDLRTNGGEPW